MFLLTGGVSLKSAEKNPDPTWLPRIKAGKKFVVQVNFLPSEDSGTCLNMMT